MKSLSSRRTIYQEKVKLNVRRLTFAGMRRADCCYRATAADDGSAGWKHGWIHLAAPAIPIGRKGRMTTAGPAQAMRTDTPSAGNPAALGLGREPWGPDRTVRPEALRPHLSMGLPKRPPVLCTGACSGASKVLECCEP